MDMEGIATLTREEVAAIRAGEGPRYMLIDTFRYREHVGPGDDFNAGYRDRSELNAWTDRDPLIRDQRMVAEITADVDAEVAAAVAFAEASPVPGVNELLTDVL